MTIGEETVKAPVATISDRVVATDDDIVKLPNTVSASYGPMTRVPPVIAMEFPLLIVAHRTVAAARSGGPAPMLVPGRPLTSTLAALPAEDLAAVLTYVRTKGAWGNQSSAVRREDFAKTRAATAGRSSTWSEGELKALVADDVQPGQALSTSP